jgi:ribosomal protein L12E/L44/L45/RPP1/RPP2
MLQTTTKPSTTSISTYTTKIQGRNIAEVSDRDQSHQIAEAQKGREEKRREEKRREEKRREEKRREEKKSSY